MYVCAPTLWVSGWQNASGWESDDDDASVTWILWPSHHQPLTLCSSAIMSDCFLGPVNETSFEMFLMQNKGGRDKLILIFPLVDSQWESGVKQHTTHATNCLGIIARSANTSCAVHGSAIDSTLGCPLQTDVTILTPALSPGVTYQPVGECATEIRK